MRPERWARGAGLLLLGLLAACSRIPRPELDPEALQGRFLLPSSASDSSALHLEGEIKGPGLGLGPELSFEAWIRGDRWLRADLHYEDEEGAPAHEVLVWGPDTCMLFDRRTGRYTELGDFPGELELEQGSFHVQHALWLALGRWVGAPAIAGSWEGGEWRAREAGVGVRAGRQGPDWSWMELVWRGERLKSEPREWQDSAWGRVPRRLELSGSILESVVRAEWRVEGLPPFGDELLNPLRDP